MREALHNIQTIDTDDLDMDKLLDGVERPKKSNEDLKALQDRYLSEKKQWEDKYNQAENSRMDILKDYELKGALQKFKFKNDVS